jgi:DNA-binding XRE family transcriptional regulator
LGDCDSDLETPGPSVSTQVKTKSPVTRKQSERIVYSVYTFFKHLRTQATERSNNVFTVNKDMSLSQILISETCGLSRSTIQQICKEGKSPTYQSPLKEHKKDFQIRNLSDFDKDITRQTIMKFYDTGEYPPAMKICRKTIERFSFSQRQISVMNPPKYRLQIKKMQRWKEVFT